MEFSQLYKHPLANFLGLQLQPFLRRMDKYNQELRDETKLSPKEWHNKCMLHAIFNIIRCIDQLHYSIKKISGYRSTNEPEGVGRYDYIIYGIENYYLRITSVFDRSLRLVNIVYDFGIPERDCTQNTIICNSHIKGTSLEKILKKINKFTNDFRKQRNLIAHESTHSEEEINLLEMYSMVQQDDPELIKFSHIVKTNTDRFIKKKKTEFGGYLKEIEELVDELFNILLIVIKKQQILNWRK